MVHGKTKIWKYWQRVFMHLATLRPQTPHVSTYFAACVGVVGGVPPAKQKAQMARTKTVRLKPPPNMPLDTAWLTVGYSAHGNDE